jgi:predicted kinase
MPGAQQLIVISGPPGSGKSALAARLHARHRWTLLAKDAIKECLFHSLGAGDRAWSRRLSDASFELMFRLAADALGGIPVLMLEGNFRPEHGPRIDELAIDPVTTLLHVSLESAPAVLERRLRARASSPQRHAGHRDAELAGELSTTLRADDGAVQLLRATGRLAFDTSDLDDPGLDSIAGQVARHVGRRPMC